MAKCLFCGKDIKEWDNPGQGHLVVSKDYANNHIHTHGAFEDKPLMKELIQVAAEETGINLKKPELDRNEYVFRNRQRIGDMLVFTCAIRDFKKAFPEKRVSVVSTAMHVWDHNPYIDRTLVPTDENTVKIGPGKLTNASNRLDWHFTNAYRVSIEDALGVSIPQGESKPDIWFTEEEYNAPRVFNKPYWLIVIGGEKGWGCKMYPFDKWQEFVNQNKDTTFVQLGANGDNPQRLQGENVIDYVGKTEDKNTGIRDLFKLFLNAEGSIGLVSFHMHLSGALNKPCIVVAGAREPVSFTRYPGQQYLATDGCLPCAITACWHCDINACPHLVGDKVPQCVDMISPEDLTRALNNYYIGGRLKKGVPSDKPKIKNIAKVPLVFTKHEVSTADNKYPLPFGGGSLTDRDWEFMKNTIVKNKVKTVLEFGSGLSTLLLSDIVKVTSFETSEGWIKKIKEIKPDLDIRLWDGKTAPVIEPKYDMAFVDGPSGGASRELSTKLGSEASDIVIVHDANRENERKWQEKYIVGKFKGPVKGGHRSHLWSRLPVEVPQISTETPPVATITPKTGKYIKIISTARGWGGCARSVTTIMKHLLKAGHKVEFIPFRNKVSSKEFIQYIKDFLPGLTVTENYDTVREACDVMFMYGDDYIWEFGKPEIIDTFSELNADRKIMMLNYRRGEVGKIPWTKGWDKYMFLNSGQEKELLKLLPGVKTKVLPPCTELDKFFEVKPNYNTSLRIVRHNSQGDTKFSKDFNTELNNVLSTRVDLEIHMLPGPSFIPENDKFRKYPRVNDVNSLINFLGKGNLFWYSLPVGYMDMGPRVIIEAMASGLPILADNWGGAPDRVTPDCGWICDTKDQMQEVIKNVNYLDLEKKGKSARERARTFTPEAWIEEILSD